MGEFRKRRRIQIHLSTAVVLMFAAGVMIWLNVTPKSNNIFLPESGETETLYNANSYGWPFQMVSSERYALDSDNFYPGEFSYIGAASDLSIAIIVLAALGAECELWIQSAKGA